MTESKSYLPIFYNIKDKRCLLVGGGTVAARKLEFLLDAGARVKLVSPKLSDKIKDSIDELSDSSRVEIIEKEYEESCLDGCVLVISATDNKKVNEVVSQHAQSKAIPVNVVDDPSLCSFIVPSIIDRKPVQVAVSTGGSSPVLARLLRSKLESIIPSAYGRLGELCEKHREQVKQALPDVNTRRAFWEKALDGLFAEYVFAHKDDLAERALQAELKVFANNKQSIGEVYLVGGGPGDPDLLTFRALRLMQKADVIVHDRLVSKEVLDMCRRDAERIYVGKERDNHTVPQEDINHLLVRLAKEGKTVCRLKGGDPFVFGRGGEEIDTLAEQGINFQVVPGVTAAIGISSYAGIPLTHRDYAQSVIFVTGHLKDGTTNINWTALVQPKQTIVFYMGLHGISIICKELIAHGMATTTPIAMIQQGTTKNQKVVTGTLESMPEKVKQAKLKPPTLIIVGEVVALHKKLSWFDPSSFQ